MRAGDLRRRVTIQTRVTTRDTAGQQSTAWTDYLTGVPANIQPLTGRELLAAQAINTEVSHTIAVRWTAALADPKAVAAMRVRYATPAVTRYFNILASMNIDERNKQIDLLAVEGENLG